MGTRYRQIFVGAYALFALCSVAPLAFSNDDGVEFFEKRVRPVLAKNCYLCHGSQLQQAKLSLNSPAAILAGGDSGPAVVAGDPTRSPLVRAIRHEDGFANMPPSGKLTDEQIADIVAWVENGAVMPDASQAVQSTQPGIDFEAGRQHWAFQPLQTIEPPSLENEWAKTPIDAFLLSKMQDHGLTPAAPAEKQTLLRRVTYDLTGLPPTSDELEAFLSDDSPRAFETVVDRLLGSPHYGERWGRHWLDLVRYAETDGHEFDKDKPNAWRYRDYVIRAFNDDVPYERFVKEHIAGDQMDDPRIDPKTGYAESPVATGFYWMGDVVNSPVDPFKAHADRLENQVDVFGKSFLGLTLACARCHDHKFDPVSDEDYYAIAGIFQSSRVRSSVIDSPKTQTQHAEIIDKIKTIDRAIAETTVKSVFAKTKDALLAARSIHQNKQSKPDILFDDFESGSYDNWRIEGEAFHDSPPHARDIYRERPVENWRGRFIADSLHNSSDEYTGSLQSNSFSIQRNYIEFLIGGGDHKNKTCVNLVIDGETVLTATGRNSDRFSEVQWDVRPYWNQEARLEIVDHAKGAWGHIIVDHIRLTDAGEPSFEQVADVASDNGMSPMQLQGWLRAVAQSKDGPAALLYPWAQLMNENERFRERLDDVSSGLVQKENNIRRINYDVVYEDFLRQSQQEWIATGDAFNDALQWNPSSPYQMLKGDRLARQPGAGFIHSGLISPQFVGAMISPIFITEKRFVHVRMAGNGYTNVVSDEFRARNQKASSYDEFRWYTHDLMMYENKRNYIEIVDHDPEGYVVVDQILFSDERKPPSGPLPTQTDAPHPAIIQLLEQTPDNIQQLAAAYQNIFTDALVKWNLGVNEPAQANLVDLMLSWQGPCSDWQATQTTLGVPDQQRLQSLMQIREEYEKQINETAFALTMTDDDPRDMRLHIRGNHLTLSDPVPRGFLTVLAGENQPPIRNGSGRKQLAQRMFQTAPPLLARVMVNRIWQHHFVNALVRTPDNFGLNGARPTHPKLLDFLAAQFIQNRWSVKAMHRLMLLTNAYQMSNLASPSALDADPLNQYVHHIPVRRLEAESIRDAMLAVSGRLEPELFGPSVAPHLTPYMDGRGRPGESGPLDGDGRRSIYINVRRNFMTPLFVAFDYPPPISAIGKRGSSTVPAQALTLLNNEFVYQQAETWAQRILADGPRDPRKRIQQMYLDAFSRLPEPNETQALMEFIEQQSKRYDDKDDIQLWRDVCHALFNVMEFIFVN
ncbi:MAG: PSD1 and planctomycete cytochrome C domain-containing protein [Candidatus Hinthialibacter antarcticus]|nr:PSD1 and planctomycete cytochrome C domain-containing protein [Candidatus Hinthialibacter antarcticus]